MASRTWTSALVAATTLASAAAKPITGCIVYKMGETPSKETPLGEAAGWLVVILFGVFFSIVTILLSQFEEKALGRVKTSEQFNTAGRDVGVGLTAAVIVSQWTWAATLLMSSNMGWRVGISGPFWYASGATIQILLFAVLAIRVKMRASHMHTFMEIVKARFGAVTHCIMIVFALAANCIVTAMLLLGGAATISDLTGMSTIWAAFLIPLLSCWIYTMYGGLRATFFASYVHTTVIFLMLIIFTFAVYIGGGDDSGLYGSPAKVYQGLEKASIHGFFDAMTQKTARTIGGDYYPTPTSFFPALGSFIENDGTCYKSDRTATDKSCSFKRRGNDELCCESSYTAAANTYCRTTADCIDVGPKDHYQSEGCDAPAGERCLPSFATMGSPSGLLFGITNIVGNFGTVFVDQSYWQSAVAAKPRSAVFGFLVGGMVWFAVPFCMATTNGLAGRALTTHPSIERGPLYISAGDSGSGLTPARVMSHILGSGGSFLLLLQLFMAITSTGSAEIIAVSSILTYDIYYTYINPELKKRREILQSVFDTQVKGDLEQDGEGQQTVPVAKLQGLIDRLVAANFFDTKPTDAEAVRLAVALNSFTVQGRIPASDVYASLNRAVSSNNIEGRILLRVSMFFTGVFALFMGFLAVFLQTLGFSLGWVYMSMGVIIGSAVGPASLTILMERANSIWIAAGAIGGFIIGVFGWVIKAYQDLDEVSYGTLGTDWPWVVGNLNAIIGGFLIAGVGSLIMPDKEFKWEQLNKAIPLVDDIEPPKDDKETSAKLEMQVKIAVGASVALTFILLVLWPLPLHGAAGVFGEGGFTFWVVIEIIWALIAGVVIIVLPGAEIVGTFLKGMKEHKAAGQQSAQLTDGQMLKINWKEAAQGNVQEQGGPAVVVGAPEVPL